MTSWAGDPSGSSYQPRGVGAPQIGALQRPFAEAVAAWQVANMVILQRPDLADDSIGEPMDGARLPFGHRGPDGAP